MDYWQVVFNYLLDLGFDESILRHTCITPEDAVQIVIDIQRKQPHTILEVGTFVGFSTGVIALASSPDSSLVCVDPNLPAGMYTSQKALDNAGTLSIVRMILEHFGQLHRTVLLEGFFSCPPRADLKHLTALNIDPATRGIIGEQAAKFAPYDLVFVDGDHYAESVFSDLLLIEQNLAQDATVILHDLSGDWAQQVANGVHTFLAKRPQFSFDVKNNLGFLSTLNK